LAVSVQTGEPVVQAIVPDRQGLFGTSHVAPAVHAWQAPSRHTPLSHVVPFVWLRIVSRHETAPASLQTVSP
jgi:hypothetical protein